MHMGWITKTAMVRGMLVVLLFASLLGLWLVVTAGGPGIFAVGSIALILCLAYTLGPAPLAYVGFFEIVVFIVFGPLTTMSSYFIHAKTITSSALVVGLSPGFLSAALLLTNNLRDLVQDRKNHKRTIAVRGGESFARMSILFLLLSAFSSPLIMATYFAYSPLVYASYFALLLPLLRLPIIMNEPLSARFNLMLAAVGKCLYLFGILFGAGLIYGAP
jgi:1,4-dihydroxy-2-naphthoate octaprenyltransferase